MKLLNLSFENRNYLAIKQALAFDANGQEILAGLTREESEWYLFESAASIEQGLSVAQSYVEAERYAELNEKHDAARLASSASLI